MKSSTLRRSNLSKQRIKVLEELSQAKRQPLDSSVGVYVRPTKDKEKELDMLWQNFRISQKDERSPGIYLATGFIAGAIAMLIVTTLLSFTVNNNRSQDIDAQVKPAKEKARLTFIPADKSVSENSSNPTTSTVPESYTVKSGDTIAGIIVRFYGTYDVSKIEKIRQANQMKNANNIKIGQTLIIPMD